MASITLLLPPASRLAGRLPSAIARAFGRADALRLDQPGERAQLLRHFDVLPRGWPIAALTRQLDSGDAEGALWLRADPAWVRPDISGARLFACGDGLQPAQADCDALLPALRPIFGDAGFQMDAPVPSRWYLRLPPGSKLPSFADPVDALGADVFEHLPADAGNEAAIARRWRSLLNEAQVVLHNHPWNERRAAAGKPPINSLWFWGAGVRPERVHSHFANVYTDDSVLRAFAAAAAATVSNLPVELPAEAAGGDCLFDLRAQRDLSTLHRDWLLPATAAISSSGVEEIRFDFPDRDGIRLRAGQRWRVWRKPLGTLAQVDASERASK